MNVIMIKEAQFMKKIPNSKVQGKNRRAKDNKML